MSELYSTSQLSQLTETERHRVLVEWNNTESEFPQDKCIHQLVEQRVKLTPDAIAVVEHNRSLTYRELNRRANQLAHLLVTQKYHVAPDVPVGICMERSLEMAVAFLGVLKAGGVCVPLDPDYPQERLAYMLADAKMPVVITQRQLLPRLANLNAQIICLAPDWQVIANEDQDNPSSSVTPENRAYIIYTSGSTGTPRGVLLGHRGLVNHNTMMVRLFELQPGDRVLQFASISFDVAIEEMFPTWIAGATVVLRTDDTPLAASEFMAWVQQARITVLDLPTAYWHEWVHELSELSELNDPLPESVRLVAVGGEKPSSSALIAWLKLGGARMRWLNTYGPSETSVIATAFEPKLSIDGIPDLIPIGRPLPNYRVYVLDEELNPVPVGVSGELHIGGVGLAHGYLNRPEATAAKFIPDPFSHEPDARLYKTGDLARYLPDGNIEFLGRTDFQVKIRGFRVELEEIEIALNSHPGVSESVVLAAEDQTGGNCLVAFIVPLRGAPPAAELRAFLHKKLPEYMVPPTFVVLKSFPLTPNGKLDRRALPMPPPERDAAGEGFVAPTDEVESQLVKIWEEILARNPIGVRQNFFDLGGHSLLAARLMHRIDRSFGKKLPMATLFDSPTIEKLAPFLRTNGDGVLPSWSSLVAIQPEGSNPPFYCVHGVGGNVLGFRELGRQLAPDQPFYALQAQGLDGARPCYGCIEDMAAHYLREIHTIQPAGPYFIGGFSFGGLVAYEMAQQLHRTGEEVALLVLFDTYLATLESRVTSFTKILLSRQPKQLAALPKMFRTSMRRIFNGLLLPRHLKDVHDACVHASEQYVPQPYPGSVTLFRPLQKSMRRQDDPQQEWRRLAAGGLEIHEIAGNHGSIVRGQEAQLTARELRGCIEGARRQHSGRPLEKQSS